MTLAQDTRCTWKEAELSEPGSWQWQFLELVTNTETIKNARAVSTVPGKHAPIWAVGSRKRCAPQNSSSESRGSLRVKPQYSWPEHLMKRTSLMDTVTVTNHWCHSAQNQTSRRPSRTQCPATGKRCRAGTRALHQTRRSTHVWTTVYNRFGYDLYQKEVFQGRKQLVTWRQVSQQRAEKQNRAGIRQLCDCGSRACTSHTLGWSSSFTKTLDSQTFGPVRQRTHWHQEPYSLHQDQESIQKQPKSSSTVLLQR